eukprot:gnl/MRDRNA2_/MRDRNA2_29116_c0_seq1.p1 gnl/MRDRNA2_/MRDRNA2_29116_c0~~gnl/MRDRNA2_/MRDRNA2_29116_c0_seq1.p1  ORF type:complete len:265 (+),score=64.55 gnl/MRDRNA2_/MRDRNA2_29116_c0_seq1:107-796(+)
MTSTVNAVCSSHSELQKETSAVISQLLEQCQSDCQASAPSGSENRDKHAAIPRSRSQDVAIASDFDNCHLDAVLCLQQSVCQRAAELQKDLMLLAQKKDALLCQQAEDELNREAEEDIQKWEKAAHDQLKAAKGSASTAVLEVQAECQAIANEIDLHMATVEQVRAAVVARKKEHEAAAEAYASALGVWASDARRLWGERMDQRVATEAFEVEKHIRALVPPPVVTALQ